MCAAGGEFVEGWLVAQVLGEGAYGEVRLLVRAGGEGAVALKAARGAGAGAAAREAALHAALRHAHVLRCLGARAHAGAHYTFLEYAPGGELFERIEPDAGVAPARARRWWRQLLLGLRYLHARGVAHRDIKPENLLLDARDRLKISDFGLATLFRRGARERLLTRVCGTLPYAAPEVLAAARRPYRAPPADLWAAGVVLRAMLTGELPWERAHEGEPRYAAWAAGAEGEGRPEPAAGGRLRGAALALLRRALHPEPARRATLDQLLQHRWTAAHDDGAPGERAWSSQPAPAPASPAPAPPPGGALSAAVMDALISHSQPHDGDVVLLGAGGAGSARGALARLARRLTRVWVHGAPDAALEAAARALAAPAPRARVLALDGVRARPVRARLAPPSAACTLIEFRRWRGCAMRFRRRFLEIREALRPLAPDDPPDDPADDPPDISADDPPDGSVDVPPDESMDVA